MVDHAGAVTCCVAYVHCLTVESLIATNREAQTPVGVGPLFISDFFNFYYDVGSAVMVGLLTNIPSVNGLKLIAENGFPRNSICS